MNLDERTKELIAVGASVSAHCQPCLEYHWAKALECGAAADEIAQAVDVGRQVGRGAAANMDKFAAALARRVEDSPAGEADACCPSAAVGSAAPVPGSGGCCG